MKKMYAFLLLLGLLGMNYQVVQAEEAQNGGFSVTPLDPASNQPLSSYYDLMVEKGETVDLSLVLQNSSSEEMTIQLEANTATTNRNGITSYMKVTKQDTSLRYSFEEMVTLPSETVTVPAKESTTVTFQVATPEKAFEGELLGGFRFSEVEKEQDSDSKAAVESKVAYVVGVLMKQSDERPLPNMALLGVKTEQRNYRNYISANLQNAAPRIIKELKVEASVYDSNQKLRYQASNDVMRMAPNSNFDFGISLEDQAFIPGDYRMVVEGEADGEPFSFEKNFTIEKNEATEWNKNAVFVEEKAAFPWHYVGLATVLLALFGWFIARKKKRKET